MHDLQHDIVDGIHFQCCNCAIWFKSWIRLNIEQVICDSDENVGGNFKEAEYEVKIELC